MPIEHFQTVQQQLQQEQILQLSASVVHLNFQLAQLHEEAAALRQQTLDSGDEGGGNVSHSVDGADSSVGDVGGEDRPSVDLPVNSSAGDKVVGADGAAGSCPDVDVVDASVGADGGIGCQVVEVVGPPFGDDGGTVCPQGPLDPLVVCVQQFIADWPASEDGTKVSALEVSDDRLKSAIALRRQCVASGARGEGEQSAP